MSSKQQATVKWFNNEKGFGFLDSPDGDVMVHHKDIQPGVSGYKSLRQGQIVEYQPATTEKGLAATHVKPVS